MTQSAIEAVITRNLFYRRLHYYALAVLLIAIIVIGIMISVLFYITRNSTHPLYFATDNVGRLIKIVPVSQPNMSDDDVIAWVIEAVQAAYSYDYVNYRAQLQSAQKYFTEYGWNNYMAALKASNNLVALTQTKLVFDAHVVEKPVVIKRGIIPSMNTFAWRIQMPLLISYKKPPYADSINNSIFVTVVVRRQPILQSYKGLGIVQMIAQSANVPVAAPPLPAVSTTPT